MNSEINTRVLAANRAEDIRRRIMAVLPILSLIVILAVFWWLKLTGITMAGDAFCGIEEHVHSEECTVSALLCTEEETETVESTNLLICTVEGHEHTDECYETVTVGHKHTDECYTESYTCGSGGHIHTVECYSDITAGIETADDWEATLADIPSGLITSEKIVAVAKSQLGYEESKINYIVNSDCTKFGYTRYGEWFGNPYGDWSCMFTAFCLRYGGLTDIPISGGADTMRLLWEEKGLYREKYDHLATAGDIVFFDKNSNGTVDSTAVVTGLSDGILYVIEGDLDDKVAEAAYEMADSRVTGFGISAKNSAPVLTAPAPVAEGQTLVGTTVNYTSAMLTNNNSFILYTTGTDGNYYAIDGNSNAVRIYIDSSGKVTADVSNPNILYWQFNNKNDNGSTLGNYDNQPTYFIRNVATGMYLHPYYDNANNHGAILSGKWESAVYNTNGTVKFRGARQNNYAHLQNNQTFTNNGDRNSSSGFKFAKAPSACTVWFDGTLGGLMSYNGSPNTSYSVLSGSTLKLPSEWQSPPKYESTLRGWYDVINNKYYKAGEEITVTENMVFYADWVAATYDVGQYNAHVADTVSTSDFITTRVFDYSPLFNVQSSYATVDVSSSSHNETWNSVQTGQVPYKGMTTLDFIFRDWDSNSDISYPRNHNNKNTNGSIYEGIYNETLGEYLFSTENSFDPETGEGVIGKNYLGEGDHLLQLMTDSTDEYYGYYYYNSSLNAAAYNQTDGRFYVYEYLERTSDSSNSSSGKYSDFLPLNSPYVNTNGKNVVTYTYNGDKNEYVGVNHFQYDAKYNNSGSSASNVQTNYMFGIAMDVKFYLPTVPGTLDSDGNYGNRDVYGNEMHFKFSGDDDVWVLVDGQLVLDIGGIHGIESGDVNFSTGVVTVNGQVHHTLSGIGAGDHVLTIYYLERGSSQSNCQIAFNLAPRFSLSIQKEDVLTQDLLNGAEFSVFTDKDCTIPASLWTSKKSHDNGVPANNTFKVENGSVNLWGFGAGNTYYIKETRPPDKEEYSMAYGIICLSLDKRGTASYSVEIVGETDENGEFIEVSKGFTVHGFRIDDETQQAFIVATNAPEWVTETTSVYVEKKWDDRVDHTYDSVTVYLTVTDPDGTVRRIREIQLSEANDWSYTWTNLPKTYEDGTPVQYGVEEGIFPGYMGSIERIEVSLNSHDTNTVADSSSAKATFQTADTFENGGTYLLETTYGYIAAQNNQLQLLTESEAQASDSAMWVATVNSNGTVVLKNKLGQTLYYDNYKFCASSNPTSNKNLSYSQKILSHTINYSGWSDTQYPVSDSNVPSNIKYNHVLYSTNNKSNALQITLKKLGAATPDPEPDVPVTPPDVTEDVETAYRITNTPLEHETSVKVNKLWDFGMSGGTDYEKAQVTMKLYANGKDTGRTVTLSLKNNWEDIFHSLPYYDSDGSVIEYTVVESWDNEDWTPIYGEVKKIAGGRIPTYSVTVTNRYNWGNGYELPATGGYGPTPWILSGLAIMAVALVSGYVLRRRRERGERE